MYFSVLNIPQAELTVSGLSVAAEIALVALGVLALVAVVALIVLLIQIRQLGKGIFRVSKSLEERSGPVIEHAQGIAANVEFISATVRTDVEELNASVKALSARLQQASDHMEARIEEFNALIEVVQGEAEEILIDAASTARGIRAGARTLSLPREETDPDEDDAAPAAVARAHDEDRR